MSAGNIIASPFVHIVLLMTFAACIGQVLGWLLFKQINADVLMFLIGGLAIFTGGRYFWRLYQPAANAVLARSPRCGPCDAANGSRLWLDGAGGIASFISLTGGIPSQVYLLPLNLPRAYYVGTMGWSFLLVNLAKLPFFIELGLFTTASLTASLALAVFVPIGVALGMWLNRVMNDTWFYHISHAFSAHPRRTTDAASRYFLNRQTVYCCVKTEMVGTLPKSSVVSKIGAASIVSASNMAATRSSAEMICACSQFSSFGKPRGENFV